MGGRWGHGVHVRGEGGLRAGGWVRARGGRECGELSRRASPCGRPGGGAAGAGQSRPGSPGRSRCRRGPRSAVGPAPRSAGTNPAEHHPRGRILVEAGGERHAVPSRPNRTGTGPPDGYRGGRAGLGTGAPGPGSLVVVGRRGGDRAGPWAAAGGGGGRGRARRAQGRTPRGPRGLGEGSRGRPFLEGGGGGGCSLPGGRRGAPLERGGGGGRVSPGVGPCRFMAARHGTISPTLRAGVPFLGGLRGGGGLAVIVCTHPCGGGVAGGSADRHGRKNPVASPGPVGPFEEEPRIRRGGLRYMV